EDDRGTPEDGAPSTAIPPQLSERARSLAARVDAMMASDGDEDDASETARAADEEVDEAPAIPPPRASLAFRAPAPTPPPLPIRPAGVPVVVVPPRNPALRTPPFGAPR